MAVLLDESGLPILDDAGLPIEDESVTVSDPPPVTPPGYIYEPVDVGAQFSLAVGPSSGSIPLQEVNDFDSISIRFHLYDGDSISFNLDAGSKAAPYLSGLATDCWLYRGETLWQRTRVLPIPQDWGADGSSSLAVSSICYKQVLKGRGLRAPVLFPTATDQGSIIWQLIAHTQGQTNGNLGITQGTTTTGVTRVRTEYKSGDNVYGLIDALTKVINGPVWRVAPVGAAQKVLTVQQPSTFTTKVPAVLGDNLEALRRQPADTFANAGFAAGNQEVPGVWYEHPSLAADPRGLWETVASTSNGVENATTVAEQAQGVVNDNVKPPSAWVFSVRPRRWLADSGYMPGDFVPLKIPPSTVDPLDPVPENAALVTVQVIEATLQVNNDGNTSVTIAATEV
jgi:hypothetical protein